MNTKIALSMALLIGLPLGAIADQRNPGNQNQGQGIQEQSKVRVDDDRGTRARMGQDKTTDQNRFHKMIDDSSEVYRAISRAANGAVPASTLKNARCIAVLPNVMTGAVVVGGTHGSGLASCKNSNNTWSQPAPISLNQGSIGLQAGAKSTDLVLYFQNNEAVQALKRGSFILGTDISAVAGTFDSSVDTSNAGVVVYTRTEGLFAGASVNGSKIGRDQDDIARYYGRNVDYTALLEGRESPETSGYSQNLTRLFPKA